MIRILVAADGSDPVLRACRTLASMVPANQADVRILTVLSFELDPYRPPQSARSTADNAIRTSGGCRSELCTVQCSTTASSAFR